MSWRGWIYWVLAVCGLVAVAAAVAARSTVSGVIGVAALAAAGYSLWVQRGPHPHRPWSPDLVRPGVAVVLWKDGCPYAHRLLRGLAGDERIIGVNVYRDAAGDAEIRRHNDGNQLTPTVIVGSRALSNPSVDEVRAALATR